MFSREEKLKIAKAIEDVIREINHPEIDAEHLKFFLHVEGKASWSFADIHETRKENLLGADKNPWNEMSREVLGEKKPVIQGLEYLKRKKKQLVQHFCPDCGIPQKKKGRCRPCIGQHLEESGR